MGHEVRWPRVTQFGVADWVSFGRLPSPPALAASTEDRSHLADAYPT
jgi:hypothetical protein